MGKVINSSGYVYNHYRIHEPGLKHEKHSEATVKAAQTVVGSTNHPAGGALVNLNPNNNETDRAHLVLRGDLPEGDFYILCEDPSDTTVNDVFTVDDQGAVDCGKVTTGTLDCFTVKCTTLENDEFIAALDDIQVN